MFRRMNIESTTLPDDTALLKQMLVDFQGHHDKETGILLEEISLLRAQLYGRKSEKFKPEDGPQPLPLFDMPEPTDGVDEPEEETHIPAHDRKKRGRKALPDNLPRVERVHDLDDTEKICGCGCELSRIGQEVSEQLDVIPARVQVIRHIRPKYACKNCEGVEDDGPTIKIAPVPSQIIPKSIASPGLLSHVLTAKFVDHTPFYHQEKQLVRLGVKVSRTSMCKWAMQAAAACQPLLNLLQDEVLSGKYIKKLYSLERHAQKNDFSVEEVYRMRQDEAKPILEDFQKWLSKKSLQTPPKGLLGKAVSYTLNQWHRLIGYIEDGHLTPDNNLAENSIRPFVVGRKNWLFRGTPEGQKLALCCTA